MADPLSSRDKEKKSDMAYWRCIGWYISRYDLPVETTDDNDLLEHVRKLRARARHLPEDASWFQVYVAEFRDGLTPKAPEFFTEVMSERFSAEGDYEHDPEVALTWAAAAAEIFLGAKK